MGIKRVRRFFTEKGLEFKVWEFDTSTATVELAAQALEVEPARIAKTIAFQLKEQSVVVVTNGMARVDNRKFKDFFNQKAKMLKAEEVLKVTGYPVGGVCPFDLKDVAVYLDESLKKFDYVYPAAGSPHSATKISPEQLAQITDAQWVDVCR